MPTADPDRADPAWARTWWRSIEPVHAVVYFAPECRESLAASGLRGFWMGYFAARAAPLGAVSSATVSAIFFNFHESMVGRAIPDAWSLATPASVLRARRTGAAAALRHLVPGVEERAAALVPLLRHVIGGATSSGRPLFSANRQLDHADDAVEEVWQACTCLREHRGDGHVTALTAAGLDGCEALVLFAVSEGIPGAIFRESRGWSTDEWEAARQRLEDRGLVSGSRISRAGSEMRRSLEGLTDTLAAPPYAVLTIHERDTLLGGLQGVAGAILEEALIPFPNPIGLPPPERP